MEEVGNGPQAARRSIVLLKKKKKTSKLIIFGQASVVTSNDGIPKVKNSYKHEKWLFFFLLFYFYFLKAMVTHK